MRFWKREFPVRSKLRILYGILFLVLWGEGAGTGWGRPDYGWRLGLQQGSEARTVALGAESLLNAVDPAVRRWHIPQELFEEYQWRQWEPTSYVRAPYERYVAIDLEGDYFYDLYGNFLTQGWLIFNTAQARPQEGGSTLFKTQRFSRWFNALVVAGDSKGQYHYALTVSNNLRTVFTPLVLSKPRLNGVQFDLATDKYRATLVHSLVSGPRGVQETERAFTNATSLVGGRVTAQLGDFMELGVHAVNVHQTTSLADALVETLYKGALTGDQNRTISFIRLMLRDDSPEDGVGGAAFFPDASDVIITYRDGSVDSGKDLRFEPIIEGGIQEPGFLAADGGDQIILTYDFDNPAFVNRASAFKSEIVRVEFRLVLANDYQIWMTSDQQLGVFDPAAGAQGEEGFARLDAALTVDPVFLLVAQADGNVQDISNLQTVSFAYGLPTATHLAGGTLKIEDVLGFDVYGEYDLNWNYRKYPNLSEETHTTSSGIAGAPRAAAWMLNLSHQADPFFGFAELFSVHPRYSTQSFVTTTTGLDYGRVANRFDLVDDNDDQDRVPDAPRADWLTPDRLVFPGWDQNNDFVPDFNQNDNRSKVNAIPDYEEPFLRFSVDRPEFLFGVDMNNNFWVDQYENDQEPDYPYRRDHRGFNVYGGVQLTPQLRLRLGMLREELISADRRNHSTYGVLTYDRVSARYGRLRLFEMSKRVEDDIADPLLQWAPDNSLREGQLVPVEDPLLGRDAWVNQLFVGHFLQASSLQVMNKMQWILFHQLMSRAQRQRLGVEASEYFFGLINKASYRYRLGRLEVESRWKSEFRQQSRGLFERTDQRVLMELVSGLAERPVLSASRLQAGIEYAYFNDFEVDARDFAALSAAVQLVTESDYLGYQVQALAGFVWERRDFHGLPATTTTQTFVTLYAGLQ